MNQTNTNYNINYEAHMLLEFLKNQLLLLLSTFGIHSGSK